MIIETGCRPSEALYAANFKQLWSEEGKSWAFTLPAALSKTGFRQRWTFDGRNNTRLAHDLQASATDEEPVDEREDCRPGRLRYRQFYDYFARVHEVLGLGGYRDESDVLRLYSLKFLRRKKAEREFIRSLQDQHAAVGQQHLHHRSQKATRAYLSLDSVTEGMTLHHLVAAQHPG